MKTVRAAFYGINGTGLGHVSRLLNVAREMRELLHAMGQGADFRFLTTTEAPQTAWDFPVYKSPSKTVVCPLDTDNREYAAQSQLLTTTMVAAMRPDLLVMDTVPQGSYGEFTQLRNFARQAVFINRHKDEALAADALHQTHLPLYDLILTPDAPDAAPRYPLPASVEGRNAFVGVIHGVRAEELWSREAVRAHFGVRPDQALLYVSAGGGGDRHAEQELSALISALADDPTHFLLVGYGPLYRGRKQYAANVVPLTEPDVRQYFGGLDGAFSAAGYNTYHELLSARVPTAFYYQVKGMDRQDTRVETGAARGWHLHLQDFDGPSIVAAARALTSPATAARLRAALEARAQASGTVPGALRAAVEMLRLRAVGRHATVDDGLLHLVAALRVVWPEVAAAHGVAPDTARAHFVAAARWVLRAQQHVSGPVERRRLLEAAPLVLRATPDDGARAACADAMALGLGLETLRLSPGQSHRAVDDALRSAVRALAGPVHALSLDALRPGLAAVREDADGEDPSAPDASCPR